MMFGLKEVHINKIKSVFETHNNVDKVIIYGSRAKGNYRDGSDIDLTIIGNNIDINLILQIENELDDLLLPYNIDLSVYHKIDNKDLTDHIDRVGIILYEKQ